MNNELKNCKNFKKVKNACQKDILRMKEWMKEWINERNFGRTYKISNIIRNYTKKYEQMNVNASTFIDEWEVNNKCMNYWKTNIWRVVDLLGSFCPIFSYSSYIHH